MSQHGIVRHQRPTGDALDLQVHYFDRGLVIAPRELPAAWLQKFGPCIHVGALAPASVASVITLIQEEVSARGYRVIPYETAHSLVKHRHGRAETSLGIAALAALVVAA